MCRPSLSNSPFFLTAVLSVAAFWYAACVAEEVPRRIVLSVEPHKPNVIEFEPVEAKYVRIEIRAVYTAHPCIDELEVYGEDQETNLAAAERGAVPSASSCIEGFPIHAVPHLNDGKYGNDHSWIPASLPCWAQVELVKPTRIDRVVFSRDREGQFQDRLPADFDLLVSMDGVNWTTVCRATGLAGFPADTPLPGEARESWAVRAAHSLPGVYGERARLLSLSAKGPEDIDAVLAIHRGYHERKYLIHHVEAQFNPDALRRAAADLAATFGEEYKGVHDFADRLAGMERLFATFQEQLASGDLAVQEQGVANADKILAFVREVLLPNPLLNFDELLVLKRKYAATGPGGAYWDWGQQYGFTVNWSCDFRPKNPPVAPWWDESLEAVALKDQARGLRTIFKAQPTHMIQHPDLNWDADKIAFGMPGPEGAFQVWEVDIDGAGLRQLTKDTGPDIDNGDPCYLPDGRIIFNSTRLFTGVPCEDGQSYVSNLCLMDADGNHARMLCFDQESNWHPSILNNGRVLYTRYEYANIGHQFGRLLFHMNPDGTSQMEYYGSNSYWPNSVFHARAVPNHPTKVAGIVCGHHGTNKQGRLVIFDPAQGRHETEGAVQTIPGWGQPVERIVEDYLYDGDWPKFIHPWPLSEKYFLVSARLFPEQKEYRVYLVDVFDNIVEIARCDGYSLMDPIPLRKRPRPPMIADKVIPGETEATVFLTDVYRGPGLKEVPRGTVKQLRLFTYNYMYRQMIFRGFGHLATAGVDGPWEPRHILGTVPVDQDGSALFKVPANTPISIQPVDAEGRAMQKMRSWFTAMPGEVISCAGCHEAQNTTPESLSVSAAYRHPSKIEPWHGPRRGFDFYNEIQPVLDEYCVGCHDGSEPNRPDFARKSTEERLRINAEYHKRTESGITTIFTPSFIALHSYVRRPHAEDNLNVQIPAEYHADTSLLVRMLKKGHNNVRLDDEAWRRLYTWIDLDAPDLGSFRNREWGTPENFYERRREMLGRYANRTDDTEWMPTEPPPQPEFVQPPEETPPVEIAPFSGWPFDAAEAKRRQAELNLPQRLTMELGPAGALTFVLIPPGEFVMGDPDGPGDERAASRVRIEKPFYLCATEITNAQYRALAQARHDSGFIGWQSIDWRGEGHPINGDTQPAVRVSWNDAMDFCDALSVKLGRRVTLPNEAQWEWAARAGADTPLWYGTLDTDFAAFENLAGRERKKFAFDYKRRWYPRDDRFEDGHMVTAPVGSFQPNPWGLYDMAGNVAEWTRSTYRPYPFDAGLAEQDDRQLQDRSTIDPHTQKTIRGGSWASRPREATSSIRWKYPIWQKVSEVGIRPAIEVE